MSKVNYNAILRDYLSDPTSSYTKLAKRYHISKQSIVKRAKKEGWQLQRREFQEEVDRKFTTNAADQIVDAKIKHLQFARLLITKALTRLKNIKPLEMSPHMVASFIKTGINIENEATVSPRQNITSPISIPKAAIDVFADNEEHSRLMKWVKEESVQFEKETIPWLKEQDEKNKQFFEQMLTRYTNK
jgi:hypothetical protein